MAKYGLLALDVDGTLVGPDQIVPPEVVEALAAAQAAELRVCLATGRSFTESMDVWRQLRLRGELEPMILVGGALVGEPHTGRSLYQRAIRPNLACRFADALAERGYAAMVLVDGWRHAVEYFLTDTGNIAAVRRGWFDKLRASSRTVGRLSEAADLPEVLRISAVAEPEAARQELFRHSASRAVATL